MNQPLRIDLRRGAGMWAAIPLVAAGCAIALAHPRDWAGEWFGWAYYLRTVLLVLGPLVVAVAAWQGGRERRRGMVELLGTTSRPQLVRALASFASPAVWSSVGFALVAIAMGAVTASHASYGHPPVLLALSSLAAVTMFAALGFVAGRLVPWRLTAPLGAVFTYVALGAATYSNARASYLSPAVQVLPGPVPAWWWAPATTAVFLAVAVATLLLVGPRSRRLTPVAVLVAALAAQPVAWTGFDAFGADPAAEKLVCAGQAPQVCLTQRHASQLPQVTAAVHQVLAGLEVPGPLNETRAGGLASDPAGSLEGSYVAPDVRGRSDLPALRPMAASFAVGWRCGAVPTPADEQLYIATYELSRWVLTRPAPPYDGVLSGRSPDEALALVKAVAAPARRCDQDAVRALLAARP